MLEELDVELYLLCCYGRNRSLGFVEIPVDFRNGRWDCLFARDDQCN